MFQTKYALYYYRLQFPLIEKYSSTNKCSPLSFKTQHLYSINFLFKSCGFYHCNVFWRLFAYIFKWPSENSTSFGANFDRGAYWFQRCIVIPNSAIFLFFCIIVLCFHSISFKSWSATICLWQNNVFIFRIMIIFVE